MTSRRAATRAAPTRPVSAAVTFGRPRPEPGGLAVNCRNSRVRLAAVCVPLTAVVLLAACERPTAPDAAEPSEPVAGNVTEKRVLAEADSGDNWLVNGGRFSGEHFSPQSRISQENVGDLGLAWATDIPSPIGLSAEPLAIDGVAYLTGHPERRLRPRCRRAARSCGSSTRRSGSTWGSATPSGRAGTGAPPCGRDASTSVRATAGSSRSTRPSARRSGKRQVCDPTEGMGPGDHRCAPRRGRPGLHGLRGIGHRRARFRDRI